MNETRVCHICESVLERHEECPSCTEMIKTLPDPDTMTGKERAAEWDMWDGILEISFELLHERLEKLAGRPIWIHEFAFGGYAKLREWVLTRPDKTNISYEQAAEIMLNTIPDEIKDKTLVIDDEGTHKLDEKSEENLESFSSFVDDLDIE